MRVPVVSVASVVFFHSATRLPVARTSRSRAADRRTARFSQMKLAYTCGVVVRKALVMRPFSPVAVKLRLTVPRRGCAATLGTAPTTRRSNPSAAVDAAPHGASLVDCARYDPYVSQPEDRPGSFPYTRGIRADGYRARPWTMRQYAGFASAEETNARFRLLLARGQTGLSTAFDLPTQLGLDSDDPLALGEVGRTGVAIDSLADMRRLFADDPALGRLDLDDDQRARGRAAAAATSSSARSRGWTRARCAARSRTTC